MKIYTKTGDDGTTGLYKSERVKKDSAIIEALGTIDELNSWFGVFISSYYRDDVRKLILRVQNDLFEAGAIIAKKTGDIPNEQVEYLEEEIDRLEAKNVPIKKFILPSGTRGCAMMHHARTICRRAERRLVAANLEGSPKLLEYFNRLSDLCFVLARNINQGEEIPWNSNN